MGVSYTGRYVGRYRETIGLAARGWSLSGLCEVTEGVLSKR